MTALLPRIVSAQAVLDGVLKLSWDDGYEGVVDSRPFIADGEIFEHLRRPGHFEKVALSEHGHSAYWVDESGYEIDFGADQLRRDAETQAALHRLAG